MLVKAENKLFINHSRFFYELACNLNQSSYPTYANNLKTYEEYTYEILEKM